MSVPLHLGILWPSDGAASACRPALEDTIDNLLHVEVRITILASACDLPTLTRRAASWGPRVRLVSTGDPRLTCLTSGWHQARRLFDDARRSLVHEGNRLAEGLAGIQDGGTRLRRRWLTVLFVAAFALPLFALAWLGSALNQLVFGFLLPVASFPLRWLPQQGEASIGCRWWIRPCVAGEALALLLCDEQMAVVKLLPLANGRSPVFAASRDANAPAPPGREHPFLFFPGADHAALVQAVHLLRAEPGLGDLQLLCTDRRRSQPADGVHRLGKRKPGERAQLIRHALLVPLAVDQPADARLLLELMHTGCPVACADRPAYRDLLADCPECMLWFDPQDGASIARAVRRTLAQRERIQQWQQEALERLTLRDGAAIAQVVIPTVRAGRSIETRESNHAA